MAKTSSKTFLSLCLPYCLDRVADSCWIALNRALKPIGFDGENFAVNFSTIAHRFQLTPAMLKELGAKPGADRIYLYDSKTDPAGDSASLARYFKTLELLAGLKSTGTATKPA